MYRIMLPTVCIFLSTIVAFAGDADAIKRGKQALEGRAFVPANLPVAAYDKVWMQWKPALDKAPKDYDRAVREYYGLHEAPYENGRYPMGLRASKDGKMLAIDCMLCHGGSINGKSYVGLGNSTIDLQAFFEDLERAAKGPGKLPHAYTNVRGTTEAFSMAIYLLSMRNPNLSLRIKDGKLDPPGWKIQDNLCEDAPAWWLLKKKKTMYHTGITNARSVRSLMQFLLDPRNSAEVINKEEDAFRDVQAYLLSLEAPKYPFPINAKLAETGKRLFLKNKCATCHGTYGEDPTYPSKIVPLDEIGTDSTRHMGLSPKVSKFNEAYNASWFAKEKPKAHPVTDSVGYQAPPLDGVWATAPYLHNGSLPTLYDVLNSKTRPKIFTRSYRTDEKAYDQEKVGWKVEIRKEAPRGLSPYEQRKIYDTTQPGRGNQGHTFGDKLSEEERRAVIEYLKTL